MQTPAELSISCYRCKVINPAENSFCGGCGAPLDPTSGAISAYLDANLSTRLDEVVKVRFRDQQVTEVALAASVAERLSGWAKLFAVAVGLPITIMGAYLTFLGVDYKNRLSSARVDLEKFNAKNKIELKAIDDKMKSNKMHAAEIAEQEAALMERIHSSAKSLDQVPFLAKKVDDLEGRISGAGVDAIPDLQREGKIFGVDVGRVNSVVDWRSLKAAGVSFAFIRATQGIASIDPLFERNWQQVKSFGIMRGGYHYLTGGDTAKQADNFVRTLSREPGDLPPVVDFEADFSGNSPTISSLKAFLVIIEQKTGCIPIIYSGNYLKSLLGASEQGGLGKYPLWLAQYGAKPVVSPQWRSWTFWQFTDGLSLSHLPAMSFSAFNGSDSDLRTFASTSCKR
jgi:lysozyme